MNEQEFDHLLALVIEDASDAKTEPLLVAIAKSESRKIKLKKQFDVHGSLGIALENEVAKAAFTVNTIKKIEAEDSRHFGNRVTNVIKKRVWYKRVAKLVALFVAGIFLVRLISPTPAPKQVVASVIRSEGVQWAGKGDLGNKKLNIGDSLEIEAGLMEIGLEGKGRLILEGPAHIDFLSPFMIKLHRGKAVMRVTKEGHGYTVKTVRGKVVDVGTEFAVSVLDDDTVETHVIEGSVEAFSKDGESVKLEVNDALRFANAQSVSIASDVGKFYTRLPPTRQQSNFLHWSFNENEGSVALANGELAKNTKEVSTLNFHGLDEGASAKWIRGIDKSGIYFDGKGSYAESEYKGIQGGGARTVCCWVKVPKNFSINQGFGIISWGDAKSTGQTWQVSINPIAKDGKIGRLRLGIRGSQIVGSSDLRDGQWHHIAVVFYGSLKSNVGTHILLYVDGKKESVSRAALKEVNTKSKSNGHGIWLGRNIMHHNVDLEIRRKFFRGAIDELYVFDKALSQQELSMIIKRDKK